MAIKPPKEITELLQKCSEGDELAIEQLMPLVYKELHKMAKKFMSNQRSDQTLQTTALIHEAYFEDYARQLADDLALYNDRNVSWPYTCIDWAQAAEELKQDYTSVDFDGETYWVR